MKKVYQRPMMIVEEFSANEYVTACGDSGTVYMFSCDAGGGKSGSVYLETNGQAGYQKGTPIYMDTLLGPIIVGYNGGDDYLSSYHACGISHEADSSDDFLDGYYITEENGKEVITPVIVWRGSQNNNTHCTVTLNRDDWETAKS